jgi:hypothetical protein
MGPADRRTTMTFQPVFGRRDTNRTPRAEYNRDLYVAREICWATCACRGSRGMIRQSARRRRWRSA